MKQRILITASEAETREVAASFAKQLCAGHTVCLRGDLGVGKTVFAQEICGYLGVNQHVNSPTFTLVNEYEGRDLKIYHFDLYRIEEPDELYEIGFEEFVGGDALALIEWPERAEEALPEHRFEVLIERDGVNGRRILIEELTK